MAKWTWLAASVAFALGSTGALAALPKRAVVLLDFSRSPPASVAADSLAQAPEDLAAVTRAMASQFTGASVAPPFEPASLGVVQPIPGLNLAALGNPFVIHALSTRPIVSALGAGFPNAGDCVIPVYRPSFGFGRRAEERRRIIFPLVHQAACEAGLPIGLFDAVIMQESRYQPSAVSPKGAFGLAQLMPGTAQQLGVDRFSLIENLRGGARYLKQHVNRFRRYDLALAAYNAGPGRVERTRQVPRIAETQAYVRTIMANWTGAASSVEATALPLPYRQAQLIFMPARAEHF